jgi:plastocyanin
MNRIPLARSAGIVVLLLTALARSSIALAATITATVTDDQGRSLPNAVVTVSPEAGVPPPPLAGSPLATATVDQKDETFVPFVVVVRAGGSVTFRNSDPIRHHVYSFAPIRRFEMVQAPGETSPPVIFDKPGSVAIGCNIHDHMIAYVHVTDAPWAKVTDADGRAVLSGIPAGRYLVTLWHPRLKPRVEPPVVPVNLATQNSSLSVTLPVLPPRRPRSSDY